MDAGVMPSLKAYMDYLSFGRLPIGGGLFDQDPQMMADFRLIESVIDKNKPKK